MAGFRDGRGPAFGYGAFNGPARVVLCALLVLLLVAIVATAIYAIMRYVNSARPAAPTPVSGTTLSDSAEATLRMRLATGEISEDDFRSRLNALRTAT